MEQTTQESNQTTQEKVFADQDIQSNVKEEDKIYKYSKLKTNQVYKFYNNNDVFLGYAIIPRVFAIKYNEIAGEYTKFIPLCKEYTEAEIKNNQSLDTRNNKQFDTSDLSIHKNGVFLDGVYALETTDNYPDICKSVKRGILASKLGGRSKKSRKSRSKKSRKSATRRRKSSRKH